MEDSRSGLAHLVGALVKSSHWTEEVKQLRLYGPMAIYCLK